MTTLYKDIIETFCSNNKEHEIKLSGLVKSEKEEIHTFAQNKGLYTKSELVSGEKDKKNMILSKIPFISPDDNFNIIEFCNYHYNEISKTQKNKIKALNVVHKQ